MVRGAVLMALASAMVIGLAACRGAAPTEVGAPTEGAAPVEEQTPAEAPEATEAAPAELFGDALRGGKLYDKWWEVLGQEAPAGDHPLWATQTTNTRSGADTWRCKECHGWDYKGADGAYGSGSHYTGFTGVLEAAGQGAAAVLAALKGETNPDHDFSTVMDEQALTDLALFLAQETVDYDQLVGPDRAPTGGDLALGEELFQDNCSECHGPEGLAVNFGNAAEPEYLGGLAADNPWEFLHKLRVGQPGVEDMPAALDIGLSVEEQQSVLAFVQGLPDASPVTDGGKLYDKWWVAMGQDAPTGDQPLWATQTTNTRSGADTWRCKECHGWDYKGAEGAYGSGSHYTGFTGVLGAVTLSADELLGWLDGTANSDHDFSEVIGPDQLQMLVAFIQEGVADVSEYVNDDKTVNGDATHGEELFAATCAHCHGDDGTQINFGDEAEPEYVGTIAADNPWEFFHKAWFGQPGEPMPAARNLGWSRQDVADLLAYAQELPAE